MVIGEGEEKKNLERLAQDLKIDDRAFFPGAIPDARRYFKNFHIFVLPSLSEAFGITILEAMSQKIPVIATNVGGIPEIIEDENTGILVPPKEPLILAQAIERLITDEELRLRLGEEGYRRYKENFTLENMCIKTKTLYRMIQNR